MSDRYAIIVQQAGTETLDASNDHAAALAYLRGICDESAVEVIDAINVAEQAMNRQTNQALAAQAAVVGLMERQERLEAKLHEAFDAIEEAKRKGVSRGSRASYENGMKDGYRLAEADYHQQIKELQAQLDIVNETLNLMGIKAF